MAAASRTPSGLASGGRALWKAVTEAHSLDAVQEVQLLEACRAKDRLDKLDGLLTGDLSTWVTLAQERGGDLEVQVDDALAKANATANLLKQLLAALRLPDEATGKRPQVRSARGAYKPRAGGTSARDRLKAI